MPVHRILIILFTVVILPPLVTWIYRDSNRFPTYGKRFCIAFVISLCIAGLQYLIYSAKGPWAETIKAITLIPMFLIAAFAPKVFQGSQNDSGSA